MKGQRVPSTTVDYGTWTWERWSDLCANAEPVKRTQIVVSCRFCTFSLLLTVPTPLMLCGYAVDGQINFLSTSAENFDEVLIRYRREMVMKMLNEVRSHTWNKHSEIGVRSRGVVSERAECYAPPA